ncbi:transcription factor-like protein [Tasmannia lanceolata]|uniref:transcription factor-like protein n=1 Tax=Tasmannia lanceolata TaxID=3420 RepID=UPI00406381FE
MSARLLRKVLKEQEQNQQKSLDPEPKSDDDEESDQSSPFRNPFDLLDDEEVEQDLVDKAPIGEVTEEGPFVVKGSSREIPLANSKPKKKKKRSKEGPPFTRNKSEMPLDVILESLSMDTTCQARFEKTKAANVKVQSNSKNFASSILAMEPKFLRAENELRRIFGSKVVDSFEKSHSSGSSRQMHGGRRGSYAHRKTILVSPPSYWPRWDGSLSMEMLETKDNQHFFRYVHSASYAQAQRAFDAAKGIHDLNGIASILAYHPYHVESLLTIAEVLKFQGEHQQSADSIEKCLFALECAWHPSFNALQGNCHLKYSHDSNKPIFSALFSHMRNMDRRGCHRSALEVCKLLLSLDLDDPMGAIFCIDYFSLRSEEYAWLERFSEGFVSDYSLWLFPNFSYSLAVCRFYLERETTVKDAPTQTEKSTSTDLMKQALMLHPLVLKKLVAKVPLKDPAWTKILKHSFFGSAQAGSSSLDHLINIYVERNYLLWRLPDLQTLLKETTLLVIDELSRNDCEASDWDCVRKEAFPSEKNEYSHLLVSDFSDSVPTVPPDELQHLIVDQRLAQAMQNGGGVANPEGIHVPHEVHGRNPLLALLDRILPMVDEIADGDHNQPDGHYHDNED